MTLPDEMVERADIKPLSPQEWAALLRKWADVLDIPSGPFVNDDLRGAADFLSSLSAPLPEEIAGMIERAKQFHANFPSHYAAQFVDQLADALRALALENERLKVVQTAHEATHVEKSHIMLGQRDRIGELKAELGKIADFIEPHWRGAGAKLEAEWIIKAIGQLNSERDELEAERDSARQVCTMLRGCICELEAERDAIERKTFEKCIQEVKFLADKYGEDGMPIAAAAFRLASARIRTLAHSERGDEEKANAGQ